MKIATHNSLFHADDVFAAAVLLWVFPEATVDRTRNPEVIAAADIVFDVGATYDPEKGRFDHHQRGGAGVRPNGVPYSSFGLVWKHYGGRLVNSALWERVDRVLVQSVDALDCGHQEPNVHSTSLAVSGFNPVWNAEDADFDAAFMRAVEFARGILERTIAWERSVLEARELVATADRREDGRLLVLDQFCPWQDHVHAIEGLEALTYVIFLQGDTWMIFQVPVAPGSFEGRKSLPESWAGLRDQALAEATGVEDAVFCHPGRFCGGARSLGGAVKLATLALHA